MGEKRSDPTDSETLIDTRQHVLFCGVTLSGKTTLARFHARELAAADYDVIVYDPVMTETAGGSWPDEARIITEYEDLTKTLDKIEATPERPVFFFVDESPDYFGHDHPENHLIPRVIRHRFVYLRLISQRPKMLPPNVRSQCTQTYMFRLTKEDARMVCADMGFGPEIYNKPLDKGDFILMQSGSSEIEESNAFDLVD